MKKIARNIGTGFYFDGLGFNQPDRSKALRLPEIVKADDFKMSWNCSVEVEKVEE